MENKQIKLTISLLVSGREDTTQKCLDSLRPILEAIESELILVDTGCEGEVKQLLRKYTDRITEFTWCNDFAKARNVGLKQARGEWFMFLDDDEWFESVQPIIDFFASGEYKTYQQAVYKVRNYSNYEGTDYSDMWVSRMIRIDPETHFEGKIHEELLPVGGRCKQLDCYAHHYGYVYANEEERLAHSRRNVPLLLDMMKEQPNSMRWPLHLLKEYEMLGEFEKFREVAYQGIHMVSHVDEAFANMCRGSFFTAVLIADEQLGQYDDLYAHLAEFLKDQRNTPYIKCSLYKMGTLGAQMQFDYPRVEQYVTEFFRCLEQYQAEEKDEQQQIIEASIAYVRDNVSPKIVQYMEVEWALALLAQDRAKELPANIREQLCSSLAQQIQKNADFLLFPGYIWELLCSHVILLEDSLLALPMEQWMEQVYLLEQRRDLVAFHALAEKLELLRTKDDIRYAYFAMAEVNLRVVQDISGNDYDAICALFEEFAEKNLSYARAVYNANILEAHVHILPEQIQAAHWMQQALLLLDHHPTDGIAALRECAKVWSELGQNIKYFAELIRKREDEAAKANSQIQEEMRELATAIKQQIAVFIEQGNREAALVTVQQLRQMLPEDAELIALEADLLG